MQERMNDEIINSEIGDLVELREKAEDNLKLGITNNYSIANFKVGDHIELRGIKFRIKRMNVIKKIIELKML